MPGRFFRSTRIVSTLLLACLPLAACAREARVGESEWVPLGSSDDPRVSLDASRVEVRDGQHLVWLWIQRPEPTTTPVDTAPAWGMKSHHRLDCAAGLAEEVQMLILRDREGTQLDTFPLEGAKRKAFAEHPLGEILTLACEWLGRNRPAGG